MKMIASSFALLLTLSAAAAAGSAPPAGGPPTGAGSKKCDGQAIKAGGYGAADFPLGDHPLYACDVGPRAQLCLQYMGQIADLDTTKRVRADVDFLHGFVMLFVPIPGGGTTLASVEPLHYSEVKNPDARLKAAAAWDKRDERRLSSWLRPDPKRKNKPKPLHLWKADAGENHSPFLPDDAYIDYAAPSDEEIDRLASWVATGKVEEEGASEEVGPSDVWQGKYKGSRGSVGVAKALFDAVKRLDCFK